MPKQSQEQKKTKLTRKPVKIDKLSPSGKTEHKN